jgi:hypothetical protein
MKVKMLPFIMSSETIKHFPVKLSISTAISPRMLGWEMFFQRIVSLQKCCGRLVSVKENGTRCVLLFGAQPRYYLGPCAKS